MISDQVNCVLVDRNGQIWVGTMDGLCRYDVEKDQFDPIALGHTKPQYLLYHRRRAHVVDDYDEGLGTLYSGRELSGIHEKRWFAKRPVHAQCRNEDFEWKDLRRFGEWVHAIFTFQISSNEQIPSVVITGLEIFNKEISVGDK